MPAMATCPQTTLYRDKISRGDPLGPPYIELLLNLEVVVRLRRLSYR